MKLARSRSYSYLLPTLALWGVLFLTGCLQERALIVKGTVVTPSGVLDPGWVTIRGGRINSVTGWDPNILFAKVIETDGFIFPGLVDIHNHVQLNIFPKMEVEKKFKYRFDWQHKPSYYTNKIVPAQRQLKKNYNCERNAFGEIRAITGGTTAIYETAGGSCIAGFVRNLDTRSGMYEKPVRDTDKVIGQRRLQIYDPKGNRSGAKKRLIKRLHSILAKLQKSELNAFLVHAGEGSSTSVEAKRDFHILLDYGLLTHKTVIVHGISFSPVNMSKIQDKGASLVWSPKSNQNLYGETLDVPLARALGIKIALSPDWGLSGSSNLLDEVNYAWNYVNEAWPDLFSEKDIFLMATSIPAEILRVDNKIGKIQNGNLADLVIISRIKEDPFKTFVHAKPKDVELVLINGVPQYGEEELLEEFWSKNELQHVSNSYPTKKVVLPEHWGRLSDIKNKLTNALIGTGVPLAPLIDPS